MCRVSTQGIQLKLLRPLTQLIAVLLQLFSVSFESLQMLQKYIIQFLILTNEINCFCSIERRIVQSKLPEIKAIVK